MSAASPIRRHDAQGRDRALERVRATTRWVFAAAVAATGIVIGLAAHFYPGHNSTAGGGFSSPSVAPSQAPSQAPSAPLPQVRTGGS